jgi:hypothetical protein
VTLYSLDPIADPRWRSFVENHPDASIFHTPGWLDALHRTYGYEPIAYTTSPPGKEIRSGQVFCKIDSWVTGRRLVSLPFSDHAAVLLEKQSDVREMLHFLQEKVDKQSCKYVEIRPITAPNSNMGSFVGSKSFYWHRLPLDPGLDALFRSFHKSCVQRKIRRAEREKLDYTEGRSEKLIDQFYKMLLRTHQRHGLPPQPISWFQNLAASVGTKLKIRIASKDAKPIAGIMTLACNGSLVYKYGCSDSKYHGLGGMAFLFWKIIQEAKIAGFAELDMGRSECSNAGLIAFKEHWGANRSLLTYSRYPAVLPLDSSSRWELKLAKKVFALAPAIALPTAGRLLYRHVG